MTTTPSSGSRTTLASGVVRVTLKSSLPSRSLSGLMGMFTQTLLVMASNIRVSLTAPKSDGAGDIYGEIGLRVSECGCVCTLSSARHCHDYHTCTHVQFIAG